MKKEIDKFISVIVLVAFAALWVMYWIVASVPGAPSQLVTAIGIIRDIVQCLMYLVVLYNALGWTDNFILKIIFIVISLFLIFCVVAQYIPALQETVFKHVPALN